MRRMSAADRSTRLVNPTTMSSGGEFMPTTNDIAAGVIRPDELYTLQEFAMRLGIRASTLRSARRAGLRVLYSHKRGFVYGRDWIEYVLKTSACHDKPSS